MQAGVRIRGFLDRLMHRPSRHVSRRGLGMTALLVGLLAAGIIPADAATGLTQINPATVPQGELAIESMVTTPFSIQVAGHEQLFRHGAEVTLEHFQFAAAGSPDAVSGWHAHAGPVFVQVVTGTLTVYQAKDKECRGKQYPAGTGFLEPAGVVHDARNEGAEPVDIYDLVVAPPGTGDAGLFIQKPDSSNPNCPFAR